MTVSEAEWCQLDFVQIVTWIPSHRRRSGTPCPVQTVANIECIYGDFDENNLGGLSKEST
jgi:hypothetical protein